MSRVAVTGAAGPVGGRVVRAALADPTVREVVAIDRNEVVVADERVVTHRVQLTSADLDSLFTGVDVVCHLAGSDPLEGTAPDHDLRTTTRVIDAAARAGVGHLVARTSATVYGAWPDNPVPLSETAPVRPNAESEWVRVRAEIDQRLRRFADENPDIGVTVLRPCVTVSDDGPDELGRVLAAARVVATPDAPPAQFVHADDVAAAVDLARRDRLGGVFNVACDGALDAELVRALVGGAPRIPLPEAVARPLTAFGWRYQLAPTPPGFVPFVTHPWVVANDKLRAAGWAPVHSAEEAFVAGHAAAPWASITPQRRQEIALGVASAVIVVGMAGVATLVRRQLRKRAV